MNPIKLLSLGWDGRVSSSLMPSAVLRCRGHPAPCTQHPAAPRAVPQASRVTASRRSAPRSRRLGFSELNSKKRSANGESLPCAKPSRRAESGGGRSGLSCCLPGTEMHLQRSLPAPSHGHVSLVRLVRRCKALDMFVVPAERAGLAARAHAPCSLCCISRNSSFHGSHKKQQGRYE